MSKTYLRGGSSSIPHSGVFKPGFIPERGAQPPENSHALGRLIFNIVMVLKVHYPQRAFVALQEIRQINPVIYEKMDYYMRNITDEDVREVKRILTGTRPHYYPDGKIAIYHPQRSHPILMKVYMHERVEKGPDEKKLILPGDWRGGLFTEREAFIVPDDDDDDVEDLQNMYRG